MDSFNTNVWRLFPVVDSSQQRAEISVYKRFALDLRVRKTQLKPKHVKINAGKSLCLREELFFNF